MKQKHSFDLCHRAHSLDSWMSGQKSRLNFPEPDQKNSANRGATNDIPGDNPKSGSHKETLAIKIAPSSPNTTVKKIYTSR